MRPQRLRSLANERRCRREAQRWLFDAAFYATQFPAQVTPPARAFEHFWSVGVWLGLSPHPLFDASAYLRCSPDVVAAGVQPVVHYLTAGAAEGRDPHPLFDSSYYLDRSLDLIASGTSPLLHYITEGAAEGRDPHPLFDTTFYVEQLGDAVPEGLNPLAHYITDGARLGLDPHPLFRSAYYLAQYRDALAPCQNPLAHFLDEGAERGFDPSPEFDTRWYRARYGTPVHANPLVEFVLEGAPADRPTTPSGAGDPPTVRLLDLDSSVRIDAPLRATLTQRERTVIILLGSLRSASLSAGPLTALRLGTALVRARHRVEFVAIDDSFDAPRDQVRARVAELCGIENVERLDVVATPPDVSELAVGPSDVVVASVWWSALQAQRLVEEAGLSPFVYLVQDYEPLFYPASSEFALAHSTYGLPCVPLVNSATLLDCLRDQHTGWFADGAAAADAIVFEPRPDPDLFFPDASERDATRRLLFYSRPHRAPRNLYEIGLAAVRAAARAGAFAGWELLAIGEPQEPASVGQDLRLDPVPWLSYPDYAALVRSSDVMLAPMLSPHPGHPTLDMAVAGGRAVTTSFGPKQADAFDWARGSVVAVDPTVDALSRALVDAAARGDEVDAWRREGRRLELPGESLDEVIPAVLASAAFSRTA